MLMQSAVLALGKMSQSGSCLQALYRQAHRISCSIYPNCLQQARQVVLSSHASLRLPYLASRRT